MKIRLTVLSCFLLAFSLSTAQELPDIIPPSPTAAELMKYGDIPVSLYTGTPSISIPIHELNINGYTLPISLNYHASGIRVGDVGSNVGLGWSLNAGGVIGINKVGANDEGLSYNWDPIVEQDFLTKLKAGVFDKVDVSATNFQDYISFDAMIKAIHNNTYSVEPDIYTFNFGQQTGKFLKASDGNYYSYPLSTMKIVKEPQGVGETDYKWKIITNDGTEFFFGKKVATATGQNQGNELFFIDGGTTPQSDLFVPTSWYLRKIKRPGLNNEIDFNYLQKWEDYLVLASKTLVLRKNVCSWVANELSCVKTGLEIMNDPTQGDQFTRFEYLGMSKIHEITAPNTIVRFYNDVSRNDMYEGELLRKIEIINSNTSAVIKSFDFTYENTSDRVYLKTVKESGKPAYQFDYYQGLPGRFSKSQDYWGYYNSEINQTLLTRPTSRDVVGLFDDLPEDIDNYYNFDNREVNKDVMHYGSLKEIVYPTGGRTLFTYEANKFSQSQYIFEEETIDTNTNITKTSSGTDNPVVQTFQTAKAKKVTFHIDFTGYLIPPVSNGQQQEDVAPNPIIELKNLDTNDIILWKATDIDPGSFIEESPGSNLWKFSFSETHNLIAGNYQITSNVICPSIGCIGTVVAQSKVQFSYVSSFTYPQERGAYTGGIRIKNIKNYTNGSDTSLVLEKNYDYKKDDGFSSGHLQYKMMNTSSYIGLGSPSEMEEPSSTTSGNDCMIVQNFNPIKTYNISTSDQSSQGVNSGHIGYEQVTEYLSGGEQGKTVYNYKYVAPDVFPEKYPYLPPQGNLFENGSLIKKRIFKKEGSNYTKISELSNSYKSTFLNKKTFEGTKIAHYIKYNTDSPCLSSFYEVTLFDQLISRSYEIDSKWYYLDETISAQYDENGLNPVISSTNHYYDNPEHNQVTRTETITSEGKTVQTKMVYPDDVNTASTLWDNSTIIGGALSSTAFSAVEKMQQDDLHQIASPIQTEIIVKAGPTVLSESLLRTNFKDWDVDLGLPTDTDIILPEEVQTSKDNQTLEDRVEYLDYYANGKVKEVKKTNGTTIIYLWGYKEQYPVAKAENATINALEATLSSAELTAIKDGTYNQSTMISTLNKIRQGLPDAMVSTYTYDPLIGVTSMTDPKGYTVFYQYDAFNRLEFVKDADGNIVSQNEYHYKGQ